MSHNSVGASANTSTYISKPLWWSTGNALQYYSGHNVPYFFPTALTLTFNTPLHNADYILVDCRFPVCIISPINKRSQFATMLSCVVNATHLLFRDTNVWVFGQIDQSGRKCALDQWPHLSWVTELSIPAWKVHVTKARSVMMSNQCYDIALRFGSSERIRNLRLLLQEAFTKFELTSSHWVKEQ